MRASPVKLLPSTSPSNAAHTSPDTIQRDLNVMVLLTAELGLSNKHFIGYGTCSYFHRDFPTLMVDGEKTLLSHFFTRAIYVASFTTAPEGQPMQIGGHEMSGKIISNAELAAAYNRALEKNAAIASAKRPRYKFDWKKFCTKPPLALVVNG